jgi:hypothetical protein
VSQEVVRLLAEAVARPASLSIMELRGLGKEHWRGIEATAHVGEERRSWG